MTAVEWLINEHFGGVENCTPDFRKRIEQAKEIEEKRVEDAYKKGKKHKKPLKDSNPITLKSE